MVLDYTAGLLTDSTLEQQMDEMLASHAAMDQLIASAKHFNSALDQIDITKNQAQELIISELIREENLTQLGSIVQEKDQKIAENLKIFPS